MTLTAYKRDGAWEIQNQCSETKTVIKFVSQMHAFVKEKTGNGEKVRISAPKTLIGAYHKLATNFANKSGDISLTDIHPGHDINRLGVPVHEFLIYPSNLHESVSPFFMKFEHLRMQFVKERFGLTEVVQQYEEKLRAQGHQID